MTEWMCGTLNWNCSVAYLFDKAMKDQVVSTQNESSVGPGADLLCGQYDSPRVYLSAWCRLIVYVGWCDTLLAYCYRWMNLMCLALSSISTPVFICVPLRSSTAKAGRQTHP